MARVDFTWAVCSVSACNFSFLFFFFWYILFHRIFSLSFRKTSRTKGLPFIPFDPPSSHVVRDASVCLVLGFGMRGLNNVLARLRLNELDMRIQVMFRFKDHRNIAAILLLISDICKIDHRSDKELG